MDYSEIMQDLPALNRQRDDALRNLDWAEAYKLTMDIADAEHKIFWWLYDKGVEIT